MRCPKCGAFMEDGREVCLMCGVNVKNYVPQNNTNGMNNFNNGTTFGSGNDFSSLGNVNSNAQNQMNMGTNFNTDNNAYGPKKKNDKDIFDFYQDHKNIINIILFGLLIGFLILIGVLYYNNRNKPKEIVPVIQNLYFEVDDSFEAIAGNSNSALTYIKSGDKGNACSIIVSVGATTSEDYVADYFKDRKKALEPSIDSSGNIINKLDVFTPQEGKFNLNDTTWHYLNIFYKPTLDADANLLKYRYLIAIYKGYYYDIELINNSGDIVCSAAIDNFSKSLKFIES